MKTFLFVMVDGGGNVPAQLSIAHRLAVRGDAVHVLADRAVECDVDRAGCQFHPFVRAPQQHMRDKQLDAVRDWEPASPVAQIRRVGDRLMFGPAAAYARDVLETIDRVGPDALAVDCLPFGAIIGAEKSGLPAVLLVHFPMHVPAPGVTPFGLGLRPAHTSLGRLRDRVLLAAMRRLFRFGLPPVNAARHELGLAPLGDVFEQLEALPRTLLLTSREYDFVPPNLPDHVRYVGPQLDDPAWTAPWAPSSSHGVQDPLVVVSLGSTYQRQERTFESIVTALGTLPVRGVATLGALDQPLSRTPPNVTVLPSAPHAVLLPQASVVVCHGGHGTVMKALACGLPLVVLPFGRDQKDNGARVEAASAGLSLSPRASAGHIAAAIRRVLTEPRFREGAQRMAAFIARDVKDDRAVAEMDALTWRGAEKVFHTDLPGPRGDIGGEGTLSPRQSLVLIGPSSRCAVDHFAGGGAVLERTTSVCSSVTDSRRATSPFRISSSSLTVPSLIARIGCDTVVNGGSV